MTVTLSWPVWVILGACFVVGGVVLAERLGKGGLAIAHEARTKGKVIELLAAVIALAALVYSTVQLDALTDRVTALEGELKVLKAKAGS